MRYCNCRDYITYCETMIRLIEANTRASELADLKELYQLELEDCLDWISQNYD